jgi:hypothetical protein
VATDLRGQAQPAKLGLIWRAIKAETLASSLQADGGDLEVEKF